MTSKPNTIRADLTSLPAALWPLCRLDHWVIWFWRLRKGRWTKPPYMAAKPSAPATTNSPTTWSTYELAAETAVAAKADGIGFALLDTPFAAIDLDHCVADDNIDQWAQEWVDKANGAYVERTPSGTGLRIIGLGAGEKLHRKFAIENAREGAAIELYQNCERYITITGVQIAGGDELPQLDLLEEIKARYDNGAKGFDFNAAGKDGSIDYDDVIKNGAPAGADVSAVFHSVVGHLAAKGMSIAEILDELARWPNGIGKRYAGRLDTEVKRSFEKWERKRKISVDADLEPDEPQRWAEVDKKGRPKPTRTNTRRALRALKISCRYDVFHDRLIVESATVRKRSNLDHTALALCTKVLKAFGFEPGTQQTVDAMVQLCVENEFDPVLDYINGLTWDGVPRLERWTIAYLGAADTELNREFGRLALIAAVRRVRRPGFKFDPIVVLEGPMGTMKSMAIEILAGTENFSDQTILDARDREAQELLAGVWLYEIAELSNIRRAEVEHIKAFASRTFDRARPAYARVREDRPRRCVLFATTNDDRYLKEWDRRFWPIKTTTIDAEALRRDRDQLWAEAAALEPDISIGLKRELWEAAKAEQIAREEADPWDDILSGAVGTVEQGEERISSIDLLTIVLGIPKGKLLDRDYKRLGRCMRRIGWDGPRKMKIGNEETKGYSRRR